MVYTASGVRELSAAANDPFNKAQTASRFRPAKRLSNLFNYQSSPFGYIRSRDYRFNLVPWPSGDIGLIRSNWCKFDPSNSDCRKQGQYLETLTRYKTAIFMLEHRTFPSPIIVLDNRDGHWTPPRVPDDWKALPQGLVLMEGHRRFNLALHLEATGRLNPTVPIWLMQRM